MAQEKEDKPIEEQHADGALSPTTGLSLAGFFLPCFQPVLGMGGRS